MFDQWVAARVVLVVPLAVLVIQVAVVVVTTHRKRAVLVHHPLAQTAAQVRVTLARAAVVQPQRGQTESISIRVALVVLVRQAASRTLRRLAPEAVVAAGHWAVRLLVAAARVALLTPTAQ